MTYLEKIGLLAHCLLLPVVWGVTVEWLFHAVRTRIRSKGGQAPSDASIPAPDDWSCRL